jgi:hypothetical protein
MGAGALEEAPLGTYNESKLVVSVRLNLANLSNEVNYSTPTEIARQSAANETLKKVFMVVSNMIIHPNSISLPQGEILFQFAHRIRTFSKERSIRGS